MLSLKPIVYKSYKRLDGFFPIKIRLTYKRQSRYLDTPLTATRKQLSTDLDAIKDIKLCSAVCKIIDNYRELLQMNCTAIHTVDDALHLICGTHKKLPCVPDFGAQLIQQMLKQNRAHTAANYRTAIARLDEFAPKVQFADVGTAFLNKYQVWLSQKMGQRGVQLYLSCLRKIYNAAIDEFNADGIERIKPSPFEHFKIPEPQQAEKRSLTVEQLKSIIAFKPTESREVLAQDVFLLSLFFCGINTVDLFSLKGLTDSQLTYNRSKTKGKRRDNALISIAVNPKAVPLVSKYKAGNRFVFADRYSSAYNFNRAVNKGLKKIGAAVGIPNLQFYAARHSWATIARNQCGVPVDDVALALCHSSNTVTDIYIRKDFSRIDSANNKVISLLFE